VKSQILQKVRRGGIHDRELAETLLVRIPPDAPDSLRYCFEVMTLLILRLRQSPACKILTERMPQIRKWKDSFLKSGLISLAGWLMGLLAANNSKTREGDQSVPEYVQHYQSLIMDMEQSLVRRLANGLDEMFALAFTP